MPLLISTGLGLLARECYKRTRPNNQTLAPALTRGLYSATKRNVIRRKRVYQNDPFSSDELRQRLGGNCIRRSATLSTSNNSHDENWVPVYRFPKISIYSFVSRAKFFQTIFSVLLVPYQTYEFFAGAITPTIYWVSLGLAAFAPIVLIGFTRYFNRIIGVVAFDEDRQLVRFGYLGFWGGRKNLIVNLEDIVPLSDSCDVNSVKPIVRLDFYRSKHLLLSLQNCEIVNEDLAQEIFGNLKFFRKFE